MKIKHEKIAAAYIRVSTEEQTELSPDSQLKEIRKYASTHGFELLEEHIYVDAGISGRSTVKRSEFNKMIGAAKAKPKPFDVILLWKFSRFARNREDSIVYKSILRKNEIEVVSISENLGDDKTSILIEAIIEAMDEYYSINLAGEVKRGLREKVERGEPVAAASFGYILRNGRYFIDEEKAPYVRSIFTDYLNGVGLREIAIKMNKTGIRTIRGNIWDKFNIEYILYNPVYVGKIRWNTAYRARQKFNDENFLITQGLHEPIIDEDTFNKVQERLAHVRAVFNKGEHQINISTEHDFILRGIVKCSNCGTTLVQIKKGVALQCNGYSHGRCTASHYISLKIINEIIIAQIEKDLNSGIFKISPKVINDPGFDKFNEQIEALNKKLNRAMNAYENGVYELDVFKKRKTDIEKEINKLEIQRKKRLKPLESKNSGKKKNEIGACLALLSDSSVSETEKNHAIRNIIEKIIFNRKECKFTIFYR